MNSVCSNEELKYQLDLLVEKFNTPDFVAHDPVQFPRRYSLKQDIEISAILTATIAWGKRTMILRSAEKMHDIMGSSPYDYIMQEGYKALGKSNVHRTFFEDDMAYLARGLNNLYNTYDSIEDLFSALPNECDRMWQGISSLRNIIISANENYPQKSIRHISNPDANSACKRMHLALKWLVRKDGIVDIGVWKNISPSELYIPLDVHVGNTARQLNMLKRKQNNRKSVEEITEQLRMFNPNDPVIYDFALFGLGESKS
ncbi:uncharacterized protein (TIGR02757 family) [Dysgonomonadaceae bacterium PH5-43]|nr:uncharacterized protein (TIGR02757 family) [Dysgonomonadaceae bacterium PH5-43]